MSPSLQGLLTVFLHLSMRLLGAQDPYSSQSHGPLTLNSHTSFAVSRQNTSSTLNNVLLKSLFELTEMCIQMYV